MALDVGIVGPPGSGKTTLFTALTGVRPEGYGTPHVGIAPITDERLPQIAEVVGSAKQTPATIRLIDVPGTAAAQLGGVRRADALLAVVRDADDLPSLELELLVADRDHVERRLERVRKDAKSGDPTLRAEVELCERLIAHIDDERALREWPGELPAELEPLTTKPLIPIVNGPDGVDLALEAELHALPADEAAQFRKGGPSAPGGGGRARGRRPAARLRPRPRGLLHGRRQRGSRLDAEKWQDRLGCRRLDPHRHGAGLHPVRGHPVGRTRLVRLPRRSGAEGATTPRGKGVRCRGRRRPEHPFQRLTLRPVLRPVLNGTSMNAKPILRRP